MLAAALILLAAPAVAEEWQRYDNDVYGYALEIPPGLQWRGEGGNGDGQDFTSPTVTLSVRAEMAPEGFEAAIRSWRNWESRQGWNLVYEMTTPTEASASARRSGWLMEMRALSLCGEALVKLQLEYGTADVAALRAVVERLAQSLEATRPC